MKIIVKLLFGLLHFVFLFGGINYGIAFWQNMSASVDSNNKASTAKNLTLFSIGCAGLISLYLFYFLIM